MTAKRVPEETYWRELFKPVKPKRLGKRKTPTASVQKICPKCETHFRTVATKCRLCIKRGETVELEQLFQSPQNARKNAKYRSARYILKCSNCDSYRLENKIHMCTRWNLKIKRGNVCDCHTTPNSPQVI